MNKIYRIVWNQTARRWMVASELTRARGKSTGGRRAVLAVALSLAAGTALAGEACRTEDGLAGERDAQGLCAAANNEHASARQIGTLGGLDGGTASGADSVAIGPGSQSLGPRSVAIGNGTIANGTANVTIGDRSRTDGFNSVALGYNAAATAHYSLSLGGGSTATGVRATALGTDAAATADTATAIGDRAKAAAVNAAAFGENANAASVAATALGTGATVEAGADNGVAVGSQARVAASAVDAVAIGRGAVADRANTLSVGAAGSERQVVNVAAGTQSTDAVNVAQLASAEQGIRDDMGVISDTLDGAVVYDGADKSAVTFGGTSGTVLKNVAAGDVSATSTEAVNGSQLHATNEQVAQNASDIVTVDGRVTTVDGRVTQLVGDLNAGSVGLVRQDATTRAISVAGATDGTSVSFTGTAGDRVLSGVANGTAAHDAVNVSQLESTEQGIRDDMGLIGDAIDGAVVYDGADKSAVTFGGTSGTVLKNVAAGDVSATSTEAVNGSQLHATNQQVAQNASDISTVDGRVTTVDGRVTQLVGDLNAGSVGLVRQDATTRAISVAGATDGTSVSFTGTAGDRVLSGVANGTAAHDAVNVSQLESTEQGIRDDMGLIGDAIDGAVVYDGADKSAVTFGGTSGTVLKNVAAGDVSATSTEAVNGSQLHATNEQVAQNASDIVTVDGRVTTVDGRVTQLVGDLNAGSVGLVRQDATTRAISVAGATDGTSVSFTGTAGDRVLSGVANGTAAHDAVNVSQLESTEQGIRDDMGLIGDAIDGAVVYDGADKSAVTFGGTSGTVLKNVAAGDVSATSTEAVNGSQLHATNERLGVTENSISVLQGDVVNLDTRVTTNEGDISHLSTQVNQLAAGGIGLVTHDASTGVVSVAAGQNGRVVDVGGTDGNRVVTHVAAGRLADDSDDAVNGSQLKATNDRVGAVEGDVVNLDGRVTLNEGSITRLDQQVTNLSSGAAGIVQYDSTAGTINVGSAQGGARVDMAGTEGPRRVGGVANGTADTDAATVAQLKASGLVDPNDGRALGAIVYDDMSLDRATLGGTQGTVIGNLGNGLIAAGSREAINGGQLWQVQADWETRWAALDGRVGVVEQRLDDGAAGNPGTGGPGTSPGAGQGSVAIGDNSKAEGTGAIGIGSGAGAIGEGSVAIGDGASSANRDSVAIGSGSTTDRDNEVSVGSPGHERVIGNVAAGTRPTDAVNLGQMEDRFQAERDWSNSRFQAVDKRIDRMGAISAAYAGMALNTAGLSGDNRVGAGVGAQNGRTALAVGYQRILGEKKNVSVSLGGAFSGSDQSVSAGAGFSW
ncbi:ESPR-type extended signal peptide-containing protein [Xanthomonas sp. 60]